FETQQILPVDARADRLRRLAIREVFPKLHDRYQRQPPRGEPWLAGMRIQGGKVLVLKDGPQGITKRQIGMACGKGRMGHTGGLFWYRRDDVWVERHDRRPLANGVQVRQRWRSVLCHNPLRMTSLR